MGSAAKQLELSLAAQTLCKRLIPLDLTTYGQTPMGLSLVVFTLRQGL
jgi:hypothetical protein